MSPAMWELLFIFLVWKPGTRRDRVGLGHPVSFHDLFDAGALHLSDDLPVDLCGLCHGLRDRSLATYLCERLELGCGPLGRVPESGGFRRTDRADDRARLEPRAHSRQPCCSREWEASLSSTSSIAMDCAARKAPTSSRSWTRDQVDELLAPTARIEPEDKVLNFDVGSIFFGGCLLDRRTTFHQGETLRVQCGLIPPHESMWIQCNLHDSQNRIVDTIGLFLSCDMLRAHFFYNLGDCVMPGDYSLVLKIAGDEIMRRQSHRCFPARRRAWRIDARTRQEFWSLASTARQADKASRVAATSCTRRMSAPVSAAARATPMRRGRRFVELASQDLRQKPLARMADQTPADPAPESAEMFLRIVRLWSGVLPKPIPGSMTTRSRAIPQSSSAANRVGKIISPPRERRRHNAGRFASSAASLACACRQRRPAPGANFGHASDRRASPRRR